MFSVIADRVHCNFLCAALLGQVSSSQAQDVKANQSWKQVEKLRERAWVGVGVCSGQITTQGEKFLCLTYSCINIHGARNNSISSNFQATVYLSEACS